MLVELALSTAALLLEDEQSEQILLSVESQSAETVCKVPSASKC